MRGLLRVLHPVAILLSMGGVEVWGNLEAAAAKDADSWETVSVFTPPVSKLEPFAIQTILWGN